MTIPLFGNVPPLWEKRTDEELSPGAWLLPGFALRDMDSLWQAVQWIISIAPLRKMRTASGLQMSVAMTSCGQVGWISSRVGYRYSERDPETDLHWPTIPAELHTLARLAAERVGFSGFEPDSCLVNHYEPGTKLSLHQDRDERDFSAPIVSVSIGVDATFLLGGIQRRDPQRRIRLSHGDVVVLGGASRLRFHGVLPIELSAHYLTGTSRYNLTFRKAR